MSTAHRLPYAKALIKYDVGAPAVTELDMLDFGDNDERFVTDPATGLPVSPLAFSNGWVDANPSMREP